MERLTKLKGNYVCWNGNQDYSTRDRYAKVLDRLAAYEDTRLTPEQIEAMKEDVMRLKAMAYDCDDADDDFHPADFRNVHDIEIIEAQQQEIEQLKEVNRQLMWENISDNMSENIAAEQAEQIKALAADKDEQAGRIMQYDTVLRRAREALDSARGYTQYSADIRAKEAIESIDALLGGKEDA